MVRIERDTDSLSYEARRRQWYAERDMAVPGDDDPEDADTDALIHDRDGEGDVADTDADDDDPDVDIAALSDHYDLEQLHDEQFVANEVASLESKVQSLGERLPEHSARLAARKEALQRAHGPLSNRYSDTSTWEALAAQAEDETRDVYGA
jgi:hypothetical protein